MLWTRPFEFTTIPCARARQYLHFDAVFGGLLEVVGGLRGEGVALFWRDGLGERQPFGGLPGVAGGVRGDCLDWLPAVCGIATNRTWESENLSDKQCASREQIKNVSGNR